MKALFLVRIVPILIAASMFVATSAFFVFAFAKLITGMNVVDWSLIIDRSFLVFQCSSFAFLAVVIASSFLEKPRAF